MLKKFLQEVISAVAGKQAEGIGDILYNNKYVNEFLIAKKLNLTINQTRNLLYKISDYGLVSSIRKKDKKKGWYTYFWKIEVVKSLEFLKGVLVKQINQISNQIKSRETKEFYVCERCNIELSQENALLHDFTCNECGGLFSVKDNSKVIRDLKKEMKKSEDELKLVGEELAKETAKTEKQKMRELKKTKEKKSARKETKKKKKAVKKDARTIRKIISSVRKNSTAKKKPKKKFKKIMKKTKKKFLVKKTRKFSKRKR
jgi:transcription factor E